MLRVQYGVTSCHHIFIEQDFFFFLQLLHSDCRAGISYQEKPVKLV